MFAGAGTASYGYYMGGLTDGGTTTSRVDRVDYSNDTATAASKGPLDIARKYHATTGNTSYGYNAGGGPGPLSSTSRLDYSSDTSTASPKGPLTATRYAPMATSSRVYGMPTTANITAANIINPDSETGSGYWGHQYDTTFDWNSKYDAAAGPAYGYFGGGKAAPAPVSTVDRVDFANDTPTASPKGSLSDATSYVTAATSSTS